MRPLLPNGGGSFDGQTASVDFSFTSGQHSGRGRRPTSAGSGGGGWEEVQPAPALQAQRQSAPDVREDPPVYLTWEDVCVTAAGAGRAPPARILGGISGHARPGEVLAIMGPSGCGKTTLLDTLAGRLGPGMSKTGVILINGRQEKLSFGTSAYVTQDNVLMSTLSVREAIYYSAHLQLPNTMSAPEKRAHAEHVIQEMGLGSAMDTRIGGRITKGISGGQRKRVSICVEMLTRPRLLFLDEPTSGLDSAASYHVMSHITGVAAREGMTVVAAVHQPGEVFELFHSLCLLANGRTVFFGTVSDAIEFLNLNGFPCPCPRNPSEHFLGTINKDFDEETVEDSKYKRKTAAEAIDTLTNAYQSSAYSEKTTNQIVEMKEMGGAPFRTREHASFCTKLLALTKRSMVNMHRDRGYYWMRFVVFTVACTCVGTVFHRIDNSYNSIQTRCNVIMYMTIFLTFMAIGGFPSFAEDIKVFRRERLSGHYGVTEFVISNTISATPYLAIMIIIPGTILYYLTGLTKGGSNFAYFITTIYICIILVESIMMVIAAVISDFLMGITVGTGVQAMMMVNGGFFRLPNELPKPVWKYPFYYISFHKYAVQGFYKNEFSGQSFVSDQIISPNATITGHQVLEALQVEMWYSKWVNLVILVGMTVLYRMMFFAIVKVAEGVRPRMTRLTHLFLFLRNLRWQLWPNVLDRL